MAWDAASTCSDIRPGTTDSLKYRAQYGIDGTVASADHIVNLMAERQEDDNRSTSGYFAREMNSYALEYRGELQRSVSLQAGLKAFAA